MKNIPLNIKIKVFIWMLFFAIQGCTNQKTSNNQKKTIVDDQNYVIEGAYPVGDVRRYGLHPNTDNLKKHPKTNKYLIESAMDLAEKTGVELFFPKGHYGVNIVINSRSNLNFYFDSASFNIIRITNEKGPRSKNINMKGTLLVYNGFGTYESSNIKIDSLILKSKIDKSLESLRNKGCHIYRGTKNLEIGYLQIDDFGSGGEPYKNNHAALAIDGQRNNPEEIKIDKTFIKSSDRHAAYITGNNHYFNEVIIEKFAQGSIDLMTPMQDANKEDSYILSGLWINRCNDCIFEEVTIITKNSPKGIPLKLDEGKTMHPTFIDKLIFDVPYQDNMVLDDVLTNILVKRLETIDDK